MGKVRNEAAAVIAMQAKLYGDEAVRYKEIREFGNADRLERIAGEILLARELLLNYDKQPVVKEVKVGARIRITDTLYPSSVPNGSEGTITNVDGGYIDVLIDTNQAIDWTFRTGEYEVI